MPEITNMMLRAAALIDLAPAMTFVGIYDTGSFLPIALADREQVQINPDADEMRCKSFAFKLEHRHVKAIVNHISTPDNPLSQIIISNLHFVCLRTGTGCMTGMSNFNMDYQAESAQDVDKTLFRLSNRHYDSGQLLGGLHALQISAILKGEQIIIGLCRAGSCSSLKLIREVLEEPPEQPTTAPLPTNSLSRRGQFTAKSASLRKSLKTYSSLIDTDYPSVDVGADDMLDVEMNAEKDDVDSVTDLIDSIEHDGSKHATLQTPDAGIERRASTRTPDERKQDTLKRETEFCEDWRAATIKSIEALKMVEPFSPDNIASDNIASHADNIASDDESPLIENIADETRSAASDDEEEDAPPPHPHYTSKKRPSRSTFV